MDDFFEGLCEGEAAVVQRGAAIFSEQPEPLGPDAWDRVEAMLLGVAIGDALGAPSEALLPAARRLMLSSTQQQQQQQQDVRDFAGSFPTDDTQLTFWALDQRIDDDDPAKLCARLAQPTTGGGATTAAFAEKLAAGTHWSRCGAHGCSNGALMRVTPALLPALRDPSPQLWRDAATLGALTHRSSGSVAACVAFVRVLWALLARTKLSGFVDTFCAVAEQLETEQYAPRGGAFAGEGPSTIAAFVRRHVPAALAQGDRISCEEACNSWQSGAFLLETVPSVLYILERYSETPEEAVVRAATDTKDNDTIASIVAAAMGAMHGRAAFPQTQAVAWTTQAASSASSPLLASASGSVERKRVCVGCVFLFHMCFCVCGWLVCFRCDCHRRQQRSVRNWSRERRNERLRELAFGAFLRSSSSYARRISRTSSKNASSTFVRVFALVSM